MSFAWPSTLFGHAWSFGCGCARILLSAGAFLLFLSTARTTGNEEWTPDASYIKGRFWCAGVAVCCGVYISKRIVLIQGKVDSSLLTFRSGAQECKVVFVYSNERSKVWQLFIVLRLSLMCGLRCRMCRWGVFRLFFWLSVAVWFLQSKANCRENVGRYVWGKFPYQKAKWLLKHLKNHALCPTPAINRNWFRVQNQQQQQSWKTQSVWLACRFCSCPSHGGESSENPGAKEKLLGLVKRTPTRMLLGEKRNPLSPQGMWKSSSKLSTTSNRTMHESWR